LVLIAFEERYPKVFTTTPYHLTTIFAAWLYLRITVVLFYGEPMPKKKTTILVDEDLWKEFVTFVLKKHGTSKKTSEEIENAMREYLKKSE
jgi:hypothetical protein